MGAKAQATDAGRFGVDETLLRHFVPMNGLAETHISQLLPFAGVSDLHPDDSFGEEVLGGGGARRSTVTMRTDG